MHIYIYIYRLDHALQEEDISPTKIGTPPTPKARAPDNQFRKFRVCVSCRLDKQFRTI